MKMTKFKLSNSASLSSQVVLLACVVVTLVVVIGSVISRIGVPTMMPAVLQQI